ncbi:cobalt-precorrin-6A reductase [Ancylobacter sp. A5.8]|uniref:cobalt-precorrin-6A reductase n=1 Tax=Ancylobacter gelatini TaxID=2919920 RepID=UPI001F4D75AD|nr:cobalt-precorrin-6A reductase [Ancylobacter gelatini]MCJ8141967.1 cobalt-precorrin-6A reductase [Ancylobacter gelatini]
MAASDIDTPSGSNARLRVLVLGGTGEARRLAEALAARPAFEANVSLAGRTRNPLVLALPTRTGGFGGVEGLVAYLEAERIDALIDATHPFAAIMSAHAAEAARIAGVPLLALARPQWEPLPGDIWREAASLAEALTALGAAPRRVFAALGRNEVQALEAAPQHHYLIRSIDPVEARLDLPSAAYIEARGPFAEQDERDLLTGHRIDAVLAKNSGGPETYAKIAAARALGIEVMMITRPARPAVESVADVEAALTWLERRQPLPRPHASPARRGV